MMPMFRDFLWGQNGMDIPRYVAGHLDADTPLYEIDRPHGQSVINMDV